MGQGDVSGNVVANLKLNLTPEQSKAIKQAFGEDVKELTLSVQEFDVLGSDKGKLKVLKVHNVAVVQAGGGSQGTVN